MEQRRRAVTIGSLVLGALLLGLSLRIEPGNAWFYPSTLALAAVWAGGAFLSGPLHLGRRRVLPPVLVGLGLAALFAVGGLVVREIGPLERQVRSVLDFADRGSLVLVVVVTAITGVAEELFFRGALYEALPRHQVVGTTVLYVAATLATGNVMLAFAAVVLGLVVGLERRATGGVLAPILTHCTWSLSMLAVLPWVLG